MIQRESALIKRAQLILTGGPSLYEARRVASQRLLFSECGRCGAFSAAYASANRLSGGVSSPHITMPVVSSSEAMQGKPSEWQQEAERLHARIARPRFGFFGVIDERFDADMFAAVAAGRPDWQLVMVGPVVKIDPALLPRRSNIHWLGQQSYEVLPHLVAQWDVCLMPFAPATSRHASSARRKRLNTWQLKNRSSARRFRM